MTNENLGFDADKVTSGYAKIYAKALYMAGEDFKRTNPQQAAQAASAGVPIMDFDMVRYHVVNMIELAKIEKITINVNKDEGGKIE